MIVYKYERKDGSSWWGVRINHRGRRHQRSGFRTKASAESYAKRYLDLVDANLTGHYDITIEELAYAWLDHKGGYIKPSTYKDYESSIRLRIIPAVGHLRAAELTPLMVQRLIDELARTQGERTVNKTIAPLRGMYRQAVVWGVVAYNPTSDIKRLKETRKEVLCLTPEQAAQLLDSTHGRDRTLLSVALGAGLRQGEIIGLHWGDIDWFNNIISVKRTYLDGQFHEPKTDFAKRSVYISGWLKEELLIHFHRSGSPGPDSLVFPSGKGTPLNRHNVRCRVLDRALKAAELPRVNFHSLRHTYASTLISAGADPFYVSRQLGHSKVNFTADTYGHLFNSDLGKHEVAFPYATNLQQQFLENEEEPHEKGS